MFKILLILSLFFTILNANKKETNFALVISGGISLGAYESGYNWAIINLLKKLKDKTSLEPKLTASAGASAGAINTLLSSIYWCLDKDVLNRVDNNLFFNTWTKIDINDLLIKGDNPTNNSTLFSRDILEQKANAILNFIKRPIFKKGCVVPLGFMVTKATPLEDKFQGIPIKNQSFEIALDLYEKKRELFFRNRELKEPYKLFLHQIYIPKIEKNRDYIKNILYASSAFPMAFRQVKLEYIYKGKKREDWFLDGGLYNNIPLDLSLALNPNSEYFLFIDPDSKRESSFKYTKSSFCKVKRGLRVKPLKSSLNKGLDEALKGSGFFENNLAPLFSSVTIFRSLKLYETINRYFKLHRDKKLILSSRYHPITGFFLGAFGAFLDENFREYDYYVGVYGAIYQLAKKAFEYNFATQKSLVSQMLEYKRWLNLDKSKSASEAFDTFMQIEFCHTLPLKKNRFSVIYLAFKESFKYKDPYSLKAFSAFLKSLKKYQNYLHLNSNSFLATALKYPDSWYKEPLEDVVERVVVLENKKAKEDEDYEVISRAIAFSAWLSRSYLAKREGVVFQPLLPKNITQNKKNILYRVIPSEIAIDTINGGFSFGYSLYWYKKWAFFEGIEAKLTFNHSRHLDDHLRLDIDPFVKVKKSFYVGAGVSVFGNLEHRKFWERKSAFGVNAYVDYNNIFRFTYVRRFRDRNKHYFYFGIQNLGALFYYLNR